MGRPPAVYSPEIGALICEKVSDGENLGGICGKDGIPSRSVVYEWLRDNQDFADIYARAVQIRADSRNDKIDAVVTDMRAGVVDAAQARVEIDALKWQMSKEAPRRYGDSVQLKHADAEGNKLTLTGILNDIDGRTAGIGGTEKPPV